MRRGGEEGVHTSEYLRVLTSNIECDRTCQSDVIWVLIDRESGSEV